MFGLFAKKETKTSQPNNKILNQPELNQKSNPQQSKGKAPVAKAKEELPNKLVVDSAKKPTKGIESGEDRETIMTNYTNTEVDEKEREEEMKKNEDEIFRNLFRSKEVELKKGDYYQSGFEKFNAADILKDFEIKNRDENGRNIIHRACIEQRAVVIEQFFSNYENAEDQLTQILEQKDKYGNTALSLVCVHNFSDQRKRAERFEIVKMLIKKKANPNVCNPATYFTPLHWPCIHGATDIVKLLLENNITPAKQFIPDQRGFFPIDYAGFFGHVDTVKVLIRNHLERMDQIRRTHQTVEQWEEYLAPFIDKAGRNGKLAAAIDNPVLQFNPVFNTCILYWACFSNDIEVSTVKEILTRLEAYPEGPVSIDKWRTPCHVAAQVGNPEKLQALMNDIYNRYVKALRPNEIREYSKRNICPNFNIRWQSLIKQSGYKQLREFYNDVFESKLRQYREMKKFKFDFTSKYMNTPLHEASQHGQELCVQILLEQYDLSLDIRNTEGWMPKDIIQHEKVNDVYRKFYAKLDKKLNEDLNSGRSQNQLQAPGQPLARVDPSTGQLQIAVVPQPSKPAVDQKLTEKQVVNKELIKYREYMPQYPLIAMKVNVAQANVVNKMIEQLIHAGFSIQMFPSLNPQFYYIGLKLRRDIIEKEAKQIQLRVKLVDINAKEVYEPNQKMRFEQFRSKDIQKVMMSLINRIINVKQLQQQKILISIIVMHDFYGIHEIKSKWEQRSRFFSMPLPILKQFYFENIDFEYTELSAIKNYFGEKVAFYYAWMSFYSAWLVIPAVLGFAITIYQIVQDDIDTPLTAIYAIIVCLWVTFFIERWKRKSASLSLRWGIFDIHKQTVKEIREQFIGDERFSQVTYQVEKKTVESRQILTLILSIPVFVILIGACVGMYFAFIELKNQKTGAEEVDKFMNTIAGVLNSIVITIINFIYQYLAGIFVRLENHKYYDSYEKSYVFKLFVFKFINTNISLFYTAFIDQNFESLYFVLVGMIIQKIVQILLVKNVKKFVIFWVKKKLYFRQVTKLAKEQQIQHQNFINELDQERKNQLLQAQTDLKSKPIFSKLDETKFPTYQRLIFNSRKNLDEQPLLVDHIELNSIMAEKLDNQDIIETSEVFILLSLALLYSCACPIATLLVMIHNLVDMNLDLKINYLTTRRPIQQLRGNIGPWLIIAQFIALAAVISNCLLLYFSTPRLKSFFTDQFGMLSDAYFLWIIIAFEHFIIILKVFLQAIIQDVPGWVESSQSRVEKEKDQIMIEEAERDENEKILLLRDKISEFESRNKEMLANMKIKIKKMKEDLMRKDEMLKNINNEKNRLADQQKKQEEELKGVKELEKIKKEMESQKHDNLGLVSFLGLQSTEWMAKERGVELEKALQWNLKRKLMFATFSQIERDLITRRIGKIHDTKKINQINCVECQSKLSVIECKDCQDHYCKECAERIHKSSEQFSKHSLQYIPVEIQQFKLMTIEPQAVLTLTNPNPMPLWKKFEYFNFPLKPDNDLHISVQKQFVYLRDQYIGKNCIEDNDKINYQSLFVDKQYDLLTDIQAKILRSRDQKLFGKDAISSQNHVFNDEELFYLNRIAYYLFRHKGENVSFQNFVARLNILQYAPFQKRCTLWLSIIDEKGEEIIQKTSMTSVMKIVYMQDMMQKKTEKDIVNLIFGESEETTINKIIEVILKNEEVTSFMKCLLQFDPKEVQDI